MKKLMVFCFVASVFFITSCNLPPSSTVRDIKLKGQDINAVYDLIKKTVSEDTAATRVLLDYHEAITNVYQKGKLFVQLPSIQHQTEDQLNTICVKYDSTHNRSDAMMGLSLAYASLATCENDPGCKSRIGNIMQKLLDEVEKK